MGEPTAYAYTQRHDNLEAIYRKLGERVDKTDVMALLKQLHRIVNQAIETAQPGADQREALKRASRHLMAALPQALARMPMWTEPTETSERWCSQPRKQPADARPTPFPQRHGLWERPVAATAHNSNDAGLSTSRGAMESHACPMLCWTQAAWPDGPRSIG